MEPARTFQDLIVWQKAHRCVLDIYSITMKFPKEEFFGITNQLRRAAVSIAANIAEGFKRRSRKEKARFFNIAQSSLEECRYYLILASDLRFANLNYVMLNLEEVSRLLESYCKAMFIKTKSSQ